ncbi:MAG: alpha/beta hydrolase [Pseudomonadota bacterium]
MDGVIWHRAETRAGDGAPWIVLVHGISQDHTIFEPYVDRLAGRHNVLLLDLPGHGRSAAVPGAFGMSEFADAIAAVLEEVGIDRATMWGTHLGAAAALVLACRTPARAAGLILEGPVYPGRTPPETAAFVARVAACARTHGIAAARDLWWEEGAWFDLCRENPVACRAAGHRTIIDRFEGAPWLDAGLVSRPMPDIGPALAALDCPVLILNGEHDMAEFKSMAGDLAAILPNATCTSVPGGGGFPLWEVPETVWPMVDGFLSEQSQT